MQTTAEQAPRAVQQAFSTWTCRDLAQYRADRGQKLLSAERVRRYLRHLGDIIVRPVLSIASPDPGYAVKAATLQQFKAQARHGEITLLFEAVLAQYADRLAALTLPTYSPKLNLIERLWKHLRRQVTHNHLSDGIADLVAAVTNFLTDLDNHRAEVLSVIGNSQ